MTAKTKRPLLLLIAALVFAAAATAGYLWNAGQLSNLRAELRARAISDSIGVAGVAEREIVAQAKQDSILAMLTLRPINGARYVQPETVYVTIRP